MNLRNLFSRRALMVYATIAFWVFLGARIAEGQKDVNPYVVHTGARIVKVLLSPKGDEVLVEDEDRRIRRHAPLQSMPAPSNVSIGGSLVGTYDCLSYDLAYAPNGDYFARSDKHGLELRDFGGNFEGWPMWKAPGKFTHLVFSPASRYLVAAEELPNNDEQLTVFDVQTGKQVTSCSRSTVKILDVCGVPGSDEVGVLRTDGFRIVNWEKATGRSKILGRVEPRADLEISQNGELVRMGTQVGMNGSDPEEWYIPSLITSKVCAEFLAGTNQLVVGEDQKVFLVRRYEKSQSLFKTPHGYVSALDTVHDSWGRDVIAVGAGATLYIYWH